LLSLLRVISSKDRRECMICSKLAMMDCFESTSL
jgi:hypothetical protein